MCPRAPLWLSYFPQRLLGRTAPGHSGNRPRSATTATDSRGPPRPQQLTWSEERGGDQEAENQTARRGDLRCHIPPPRAPPTKSTPQEGASSPGPPGPPARGSRLRGGGWAEAFSQTHGPRGLWRCAVGSAVPHATFLHQEHATPPSPSTPALCVFGCYSHDGRPSSSRRRFSK